MAEISGHRQNCEAKRLMDTLEAYIFGIAACLGRVLRFFAAMGLKVPMVLFFMRVILGAY